MFVQKLYKWLQNVFNVSMYRTLVFSFRRTKKYKKLSKMTLYQSFLKKRKAKYPDLENS